MQDREHFERRVGTTIRGKWTIDALIGVGGMAAVYSAMHKIGRREALKILHPEVARNKDLRTRFEHEAHAVNRFTHPGVVEIRDIDTTEDGAPFLVMEFLEGEDLAHRAKRLNGIETEEMLRMVDDLLDVLVAAHAMGIVHRDIKLDNLFLLHDGQLKVLDFGIARMKTDRTIVTQTGATLGTVAYMPPEQVKGMPIDARADLFAVGATMFRLVARQRIHDARSEAEMLVKMATEPAAPLIEVAPTASPELCNVVDRALAFERERRYPDAATMQNDIRALRRSEAPPFSTARLSAGDDPKSKQLPEPEAASAAQAVVVGAAGAGVVTAVTAAFGEEPTAATDAFDATVAPSGAAAPVSVGMPASARPTVVEPTNPTSGPVPPQVPPLSVAMPPAGSIPEQRRNKGLIPVLAVVAGICLLGAVGAGAFALWSDDDTSASQEPDQGEPSTEDDGERSGTDTDDDDDDDDEGDDDDDDDDDDRRLEGPLSRLPGLDGPRPPSPGDPKPPSPGDPKPPSPGDPKPPTPGDPKPPPPPPKQGGGFKLPLPGEEPPPPPIPGSSDDKKKKKKKKKKK